MLLQGKDYHNRGGMRIRSSPQTAVVLAGLVLAGIVIHYAAIRPWMQEHWLESLLLGEIATGTVSRSRALLLVGANVNGVKAIPPLKWAIMTGRSDSLTLLLRSGADPNHNSGSGYPLNTAIECRQFEMVAQLLKHGADPNLRRGRDFTAWQTSAMWRDPQIVSLLVDAGVDPNVCEPEFGTTWLMSALITDNLPMVKALVSRGADPQKRDFSGASALDYARRQGRQEILAFLRSVRPSTPPVRRSAKSQGTLRTALLRTTHWG